MISDSTNANSDLSAEDEKYMWRCLQLARYSQSYVAPNPMVGAVIVYDGKIIGEGYHHKYGQAHAEPNAIHSVKQTELLKKSTLYVNLEPCSHYGKTPPCANLIVETGIPRVVIGTTDPNPKVSGRGVKILQAAGIEVITNVLADKCRELNKRFFIFQEQKRPFILLKWAQTSDGFIDHTRESNTQKPLQISNAFTRQLTHKMRSENQAILVSTNTVVLDNPSLTVRNWSGQNPVRVAIDRNGRIPKSYHLMDGQAQTIIFTSDTNRKSGLVEFIAIDFDENTLDKILKKLYERNIHSVLVEGGAQLLNNFIKQGLWDEANIEVATVIAHEGIKAPVIDKLPTEYFIYEQHKWMHFVNHHKKSG